MLRAKYPSYKRKNIFNRSIVAAYFLRGKREIRV
jgi:hypothetical protein